MASVERGEESIERRAQPSFAEATEGRKRGAWIDIYHVLDKYEPIRVDFLNILDTFVTIVRNS